MTTCACCGMQFYCPTRYFRVCYWCYRPAPHNHER